MTEERFLALQQVVTPEIQIEIRDKDIVFVDGGKYLDADEEMQQVANWIKANTFHNSEVKPERIKFLYTTVAKKDGGRYVLGTLQLRSDIEKMVNDSFDYIVSVHYKSWKELDISNKVIQLDKILCGISMGEGKTKKTSVDSKEFINNLRHYGAEVVLQSSEIVDMTIDRIIEQEKLEKKQ